jgi:uncharacterized protein
VPPAAETKVAAATAALRFTDTMLARARGMRPRRGVRLGEDRWVNPFQVMWTPPPGVPKSAGIAQDTNISNMLNWVGEGVYSSFAEGVTFMGYAYLSELAQRPEYRRIIETISTELTRKWIKISSRGDEDKSDKVKALEELFENLKVKEVHRRVANYDGFFGRGHVYIELEGPDDREELITDIGDGLNGASKMKVRRGSLKALRPVEPVWCYPTTYNSIDPLKEDWYNPTQWYVMGRQLHSSRLLRYVGREVPDLLKPAYAFGGLSMSQMAKPYVDNWLRTRQSVSDLIHSFSVFVLMTDLSIMTQPNGEENILKHVEWFNTLRDNQGLMLLNKTTEEFRNITVPLGTLDQLQAQSQEHLSSVSGIPLVKLLGISPHGLNASSEGEIRVFYDWIHSYQELLLSPNLWRIFRLAQLSLFGAVDPELTFEFEPLWELDEKSLADLRKVQADTAQVYIDIGVLGQDEVRKQLADDPDSPWQGLDVEKMPDLKQEEEQGLMPKGAGRGSASRAGAGGEPSAEAAGPGAPEVAEESVHDEDDIPAGMAAEENGNGRDLGEIRKDHLGSLLAASEEDLRRVAELIAAVVRGGGKPNERTRKLATLLAPRDLMADMRGEMNRYQKLGALLVDRDKGVADEESANRFVKLAQLLAETSEEIDYDSRFQKLARLIGGEREVH